MINLSGMVEWYSDGNLTIEFGIIPCVAMRYATPSMTDEEKKSIIKFPFINKKNLHVRIFYSTKKYEFEIKKGFVYDGMTIPRIAWTLIGISKESPGGLIASLLHDYMCINKDLIDNNRALSTEVFAALLKVGGVNPVKCFLMKNSVAVFQTLFCNWEK